MWVCSRAQQLSPSPCANSQPQKDVSIVLWHRDKMKSEDSTLVSGSSFPCSLCLLQLMFKEEFAALILPNVSLEVLNGKHPAYL